ncbi:MAG: 50S ribosomal protein L24 [Erysipelotrichaceae bacterium]|nr:50S ribosomal protein L24 [Erysipelotrichaceae bacterium]MBR3693456.1 50S ribosomal protein L24 [Erysipelotrichales bacterium]
MKIKTGDKVQVIAGSYKGTVGEVKQVFPKTNKVVVEGVAIAKKHLKPTQVNPDGGIVEKEAAIDASNVMVVDAKTKKPSRVGYRVEKDQKVRYTKKSGSTIK